MVERGYKYNYTMMLEVGIIEVDSSPSPMESKVASEIQDVNSIMADNSGDALIISVHFL